MILWNFKTATYDTVTTITDANARNYMPENKILENRYVVLREIESQQPGQALEQILASHHVWN